MRSPAASRERGHGPQGRRLPHHGRQGQGGAHSGANFQDGRSAIGALAAKITALHTLTNLDRGLTCNVGLVSGGQSVNTVAPEARAEIDLRYVKAADRLELLAACEAIAAREDVEGTSASLSIKGDFLPLEQTPGNMALFDTYAAAAQGAGLAIGGEYTGGCADSGFTSAVGAPTLCATGPLGARAHTPRSTWSSTAWCRAPRHWRWRLTGSAPSARQVDAAQFSSASGCRSRTIALARSSSTCV